MGATGATGGGGCREMSANVCTQMFTEAQGPQHQLLWVLSSGRECTGELGSSSDDRSHWLSLRLCLRLAPAQDSLLASLWSDLKLTRALGRAPVQGTSILADFGDESKMKCGCHAGKRQRLRGLSRRGEGRNDKGRVCHGRAGVVSARGLLNAHGECCAPLWWV